MPSKTKHNSRARRRKRAERVPALSPCVVRRVAPEDVKPGRYVVVLRATVQLPPRDDCLNEADVCRLVSYLPPDAGTPLRVLAVCLPFVHVRGRWGVEAIDTRLHELGSLPKKHGKALCKAMRHADA